MAIYASFLGHVELPSIDDRPPRQIPEARIDRRPASRRRRPMWRNGQDA